MIIVIGNNGRNLSHATVGEIDLVLVKTVVTLMSKWK